MLCCKNVTGELICTSCLHLPGYGEKRDLWHCPLCHQRDSPVLIPNASGQRWAAFFSFLPQPLQLGMATSLLGGLGDKDMRGDSWVSPGTGDAGELGKMRWISGAVYRYNLKCGQGFGIGFSLSIFFSFPYPQNKLRFIHVQLAVKSVWCHAGSDTQR